MQTGLRPIEAAAVSAKVGCHCKDVNAIIGVDTDATG